MIADTFDGRDIGRVVIIGLIDNQLSKSLLLSAIDTVLRQNEICHYFPSYEIMLDELRDYRFYEKDMLHPSEEAIDYIWNYFKRNVVSLPAQSLVSEIEKIQSDLQHKIMRPGTSSHQTFLLNLIQKIDRDLV